MSDTKKPVGSCARCGRRLTDPGSVKRGLGPDCWAKSNGDIHEKDLGATPEEWARREDLLRNKAGEVDFGTTWPYLDDRTALLAFMRVSVRYDGRTEMFEAYGAIPVLGMPNHMHQIVFLQSTDIRAAYEAAVNAGPQSQARAYRASKDSARGSRQIA
jgi:hypothetical protein